jgi:hypothetical protein
MAEEIHPLIAARLRTMQADIDAAKAENAQLNPVVAALERREIHLDDMPGKQLPFKFQINIPLPGGTTSPTPGTVTVSRDGPFVARRLFASCVITDAPIDVDPSLDYSHMINRFMPVTSTKQYNLWATNGTGLAASAGFGAGPFVPPLLDFEWEYSDGGSERNRQDKPISGDLLFREDEDGYFMNNEVFAAGTTISFIVHPLRAVPTDFDLLFKVTFDGFKVLQPLEM